MKKLFLTAVSIFLILNTFSCEKKNTPSPNEDVPEISAEKPDEKTTLNIATTIDLSTVKNLIVNKMSCDVNIKFYPYSDETNPFELLNLDMISGEDIDVVYSMADDMIQFIKNGYMTDLYPLMEQSETLKKEDFLSNVLTGLEIDGKLPVICDDWILYTAVAKTENVGENMENWTPEQAFKAFDNMPEDMTFLDNEFKEYDRLNFFIKRVAFDSVDYKNNTCDFGGAFMETLDGINNLPAFQPSEWEGSNLIKNHALVKDIYICGINSAFTQETYAQFGGADITFVGYPSESGKGYVTDAISMLGILETSSNKQEGYEFMELMLNENSINKDMMYSMPVTEKNLTDQLNATKYSQLSVNCPQYLPDSNEQVEISEKAVRQAVEYIRNVEFEPYNSDTVERIVSEEYHKCYYGETTPQQCADNLNNRISLYLSETE